MSQSQVPEQAGVGPCPREGAGVGGTAVDLHTARPPAQELPDLVSPAEGSPVFDFDPEWWRRLGFVEGG